VKGFKAASLCATMVFAEWRMTSRSSAKCRSTDDTARPRLSRMRPQDAIGASCEQGPAGRLVIWTGIG